MSVESEVRKAMTPKNTKEPKLKPEDYLSTGSTLLNLALTGFARRGFAKGFYYFIVGDSQSGKTWLSLTCGAESNLNAVFKDHRLIFDDVEGGALMDVEKYFGKRTAERLEPPGKLKDGTPVYSETVEDFYYHLDDACKKGIPFIYVLDSMDALDSEDAAKKFEANKKIHRRPVKPQADDEEDGEGPKKKGSYGDGKPKANSQNLRRFIPRLRKLGAILIIVNQTRDNIPQPGMMTFEKKTRSGGHALKFYSTVEIWSSVAVPILKTVKGKKRKLGAVSKVTVKKNRLNGRDRTVMIPFYYSYGFDDLRACIDYLADEGHWKGKKESVKAPEFDFEGPKDALIKKIEEEGLGKELRTLVARVWREIDAACELKRKPRYE